MGKKLKITFCQCEMGALMRPKGPISVEKTKMLSPDVLEAQLKGKSQAVVRAVRVDKDTYVFDGPKELGGRIKIPADSLTDCLHYRIHELNHKIDPKYGI